MKNILITSAVLFILSTPTFAQEASSEKKETPATQETSTETPTAPAQEVPSTESREWPRSLWGVYGGLGLPHVLNGGLEYLDQSRTWAVAVDIGGFSFKPKDEENDKEEVALGSFAIEGRYHPFTSSFYIAGAVGAQSVSAKKTASYSGETVTPEVKINNTFVTPKIGWFWQFNSGLNFGVELGAQIPLSKKVDIEDGTTNPIVINDPEYIKNKKDVEDLAEKLGEQVLPHALVRIGYAF
ncbi:hypothetical protein [Bdellovibrio sp. HCB-110]|uniref:hypothetical protein n=1 Tax=Bdellovibrio sp. HCB-110 TaxID=3391182 RepID=UPI0039B49AD6